MPSSQLNSTPSIAETNRRAQALYRRALNHRIIPPVRHINGLAYALEDLHHALEHDPDNAEVREIRWIRSDHQQCPREGRPLRI